MTRWLNWTSISSSKSSLSYSLINLFHFGCLLTISSPRSNSNSISFLLFFSFSLLFSTHPRYKFHILMCSHWFRCSSLSMLNLSWFLVLESRRNDQIIHSSIGLNFEIDPFFSHFLYALRQFESVHIFYYHRRCFHGTLHLVILITS